MSRAPRARLGPRLRHVASKRSPRDLARIAAREAAVRRELRADARALERAARSGAPVLAGPFVGNVGYELLYWIPILRRLLRTHGIAREQVTVLTRGGAALWYADLAARSVDVFELLDPADFLDALGERRRSAGDDKQLLRERLDRELIRRSLERIGPAEVVHPSAMFGRLRWLWRGWQPAALALHLGDYRTLEVEREELPDLPDDYAVVKPYFNDCLPETPANRELLGELVERLARESEVVELTTGLNVDPHVEWRAPGAERLHRLPVLEPSSNLALQTQVLAGARALVAPYGGFSYLGPFLGVRTVCFESAAAAANPVHRRVLESALRPDFAVIQVGSASSTLDAIVDRACAVRAAA